MPPQSPFPPIPDAPLQEGARWRHHKPSSEQVAAWFATQPMDEGMEHAHYVGGIVLIPQSEKVKYTRPDGSGTVERYENVWTPYLQIGARIGYFRRLAELRGLVPRIVPAVVPRSSNPQSPYFNASMPEGFWYHVVPGQGGNTRYLCCTMLAQMFEPQTYGRLLRGEEAMPVLEGVGDKQGSGGTDPNGVMKIRTGAIGRAIAAAGILVIGTGVSSSEDMAEFSGLAAPAPELPQLPDPLPEGKQPDVAPQDETTALRAQALALQAHLQETDGGSGWQTVVVWWRERAKSEGWTALADVPPDSLKGVVSYMERVLADAQARAAATAAQGVAEAPQA